MTEETIDTSLSNARGTLDLTAVEKYEVLQGIEECYARYLDAYELQSPDAAMAVLTDDYELIFPAERQQPNWDKARIERDVRRCGPQPRGRLTMRALIEELLSIERDPSSGTIVQATVRTLFLREGSDFRDNSPFARIDTFTRTASPSTVWKIRRTMGLSFLDR